MFVWSMNTFRSVFKAPESQVRITHEKPVLLMGSCFSENMEARFADAGFQVLANPFGIQYNPLPVFTVLSQAFSGKEVPNDWIEDMPGGYINWMAHHTRTFNGKEEIFGYFNQMLQTLSSLPEGTTIFLTYGTAWYYRLKRNAMVVANCHKFPSNTFTKQLAGVEEIVNAGNAVFEQMQRFQIINTVSPVRHLRDGFTENQRSKATLLLSVARWESLFTNVSYFPSYEWVIDDLRDYRFFKNDYVHPSDEAIDYVWERLKEMYFPESVKGLATDCERASRASRHRAINPQSDATKAHVTGTLQKIELLEKRGAHLASAKERLINMLPKSE